MKKLTYILPVILSSIAAATTVGTREGASIIGLSGFVSIYVIEESGKLPDSWNEIFRHEGFYERMESRFARNDRGLTELYSFIAPEQRSLFPDGELLLIRSEPIDWPEVWKHDDVASVDPSDLTEEQQEKLERLDDHEQPIRYLLYRDKRGEIRSTWWYESDVQAMLAETGIRVPEPTPYRPAAVSEQETGPGQVTLETAESRPPATATGQEKPATTVHEEHQAESSEEKSSRWWIWLIGALIVLGGLGIMLGRKKS